MAAWSTTDTVGTTVKVTIVQSSGNVTKEFDKNLTVAEACLPFATENGLKDFDIEDADGSTIEEDEGDKKLSEVGALKLYPQAIAA